MRPLVTSYSPKELAGLWNCSTKTILRAVRSGDLPALHLGQKTIRITEVDAGVFYLKRSSGLSSSGASPSGGRPWGS